MLSRLEGSSGHSFLGQEGIRRRLLLHTGLDYNFQLQHCCEQELHSFTLECPSSCSWPRLYSISLAYACKHPPVCKYREDDIFAKLEREASFYEGKLRELHGEAVPRFYGQFKGSYTDSARQRRSHCVHHSRVLLEPRLGPMGRTS